jgi:peptide/nickel transport system permease protein
VLRYLLNRLVGLVAVMFIVATIVFVIIRVTPGDPAAVMLGPQASQQDIAALRTQLGLDQPMAVQYVSWLGKLAQGDLGQSIFMNKPVLSALADRAEPTILLTLMSLLIASAIALPVGILSAVKRGTTLDQSVLSFSMFTSSVPSFWLGLLLMQVFSVKLGWLPVAGYGGPDASLMTRLSHLILPAVVLGLVNSALITRFIRASMLDVLRDDYVRTARAKGLPESKVILKHAVRNALIPILTVLGLTTALLIIAAIYVLINLFIDLLYLLVDPRVRY